MSGKRSSSMSQINNFATTEQIKSAATPDDAVAAFLGKPIPSGAPGTQPVTSQVTTKAKVAGQEDSDTEKVEQPSALSYGVNAGYDFVRTFYRTSKARLEKTPIPGGIMVPFGILFILFLALLPVNGHTRIMWLWLALTNQAQIGGPLTPITALSAPTNNTASASTSAYNTGSPQKNPNQTGTTVASSHNVSASKNTATISTGKHSTTTITNTQKTHTTTKKTGKGGGPGPYEMNIPDPTAPVHQLSYSYLLRSYNGYE